MTFASNLVSAPTYSFVIPVYNEEENLPELYTHLKETLAKLDAPAEIILIDDGSCDRSLELMRQLHERDARIRYLSLARNFGHQTAVTAGLHFVQGQAIIVMDSDLQDPPELVLELIERWQQGYQVVYAQRISRQQEGWLKRGTAYLFYRILNILSEVKIPTDTGDFCLMDRQVVDLLNRMPEKNRYIRGLRAWVGFRQTAVKFQRPARFAGEIKYTFRRSLGLAINSILGFSRKPLRVATYLGLITAVLALIMMLLTLYWRFFDPTSPLVGFTLITMAIFFLGAVQLICIGILGEYIGRIYEEIQGRPLYTLKEIAGFQDHNLSNLNRHNQVGDATTRQR
ncbi:MAG: glycosyltransferase family 2 protein [Thermosynechococcaceae cyanobacterium]